MAAEHILTPTPLLCAELIASLSAVEMSILFRGITVMRVVTAPEHARPTRTLCSYRDKTRRRVGDSAPHRHGSSSSSVDY